MSKDSNINPLLQSSDKGLTLAHGVLAKLARKLMLDLNTTPNAYFSLMRDYLNNPVVGIPQNTKDRSSAQGNLTKAIARDDMTWKTLEKILLLHKVVDFRLTLDIRQHGKSKWTSHSLDFNGFGGGYGKEHVVVEKEYVPKQKGPVIDYYITNIASGDVYITQDLDDVVARMRLTVAEVDQLLSAAQEGVPYVKGMFSVLIEGLASSTQTQAWNAEIGKILGLADTP